MQFTAIQNLSARELENLSEHGKIARSSDYEGLRQLLHGTSLMFKLTAFKYVCMYMR